MTTILVSRRGLTLIELAITICIIGLLIALLLPAVQSARSVSRRLQCKSNLRQIGIANQNYTQIYGAFPSLGNSISGTLYIHLLPFIEQNNFFNAWNFEPTGLSIESRNITLYSKTVNLYLCPEDKFFNEDNLLSYPSNQHFDIRTRSSTGAFTEKKAINPAMVSDGLSNTAFFGEFVHGSKAIFTSNGQNFGTIDLRRPTFWIEFGPSDKIEMDLFFNRCDTLTIQTFGDNNYIKGQNIWLDALKPRAGYDHLTVPNGNTCMSDAAGLADQRVTPASSVHPGGVHISFGDAHVAFVKNGINRDVWSALGSRNGGEPISGNAY